MNQTKHSMSELDPILLTFDDDLVLTKFRWLDNWMLYLPLFVPLLPTKKFRSKFRLKVVCLLIILISLLVANLFYTKTNFEADKFTLIAFIISYILIIFTRAISLYYYRFHFNYPWYSQYSIIQDNTMNTYTE
eukprot:219438_1